MTKIFSKIRPSSLPTLVTTLLLVGVAACDSGPSTTPADSTTQIESSKAETKPAHSETQYPDQVFFGDTHLHTSNSGDAFAYGARLSPDHAYRFAKGEEVISSTGQKAKLSRPLDFLVVADHAEGLGLMQSLLDGHKDLVADPQMARWSKMVAAGGKQSHLATQEIIRGLANKTLPAVISDPKQVAPFARGIWQNYLDVADQHNRSEGFTALIGYEYSSQPQGNNLHRVVILRDGADKAGQVLPFSSTISENPEDLWAALARYESKTGGKALAIPHNPNLSNGKMFDWNDFDGEPITGDYALKRSRWEPLVETTQIKGDSESHPFLSPNDEYASYGDAGWQQGNLTLQTKKSDAMLGGEYTREALKRGIKLEQSLGANPFQFGLIGSTDSHTALATGDEDNFFGKNRQMEPSPVRANKIYKQAEAGAIYGWQYLAGGYAAVWATENTREALFDAMLRKEVYATTGPRIRLRMFAGYEYTQDTLNAQNFVQQAYQLGVPMGGEISRAGDRKLSFLVKAAMDAQGNRLAKLQVVKGWLDGAGVLQEKIFDIEQSNLPDGEAELNAYWQDPEFDPTLRAFYYVRVLEVPSYRWSVNDAAVYGIDLPEQAKQAVRERAYSSPIWYSPD